MLKKRHSLKMNFKKLVSLLTEAVAGILTLNKITPIILCALYVIFNSLPLLELRE